MKKKKCTVCKVEKAIEEFYKHPRNSDGRQSNCIECTKRASNKKAAVNDIYFSHDRKIFTI